MTHTFTDTPEPPPKEWDEVVSEDPDAELPESDKREPVPPVDPKDPLPNDESADPGIPVKSPSPDTTESPS